jgi:hypothetical protein
MVYLKSNLLQFYLKTEVSLKEKQRLKSRSMQESFRIKEILAEISLFKENWSKNRKL